MSKRVPTQTEPETSPVPVSSVTETAPPFDPRGLVDSWESAIGAVAATDPTSQVAEGGKRGPRGPRAPAPPSVHVTAEKLAALTRPIWRIACDMAKVSRVTDEELREWSEASAPFAEKYLGKLLQERAEVFAFVIATLVLAAPRLEQAFEARQKDKERKVEVSAGKEF